MSQFIDKETDHMEMKSVGSHLLGLKSELTLEAWF